MAPLSKGTPASPELLAAQVSDGPPAMVMGQLPVATAPVESLTPMLKVPAACGVPPTSPVEVFRLRPVGREPLGTEKVKGPVPPLTDIGPLSNVAPASPEFVPAQVSV